jgi:hypothetical protein
MKKFKWPWPFKKKKVKRGSIDLSDFKDEIDPWLATTRATRNARNLLDEHYKRAHTFFWAKLAEIVGHELPGNWIFDAGDYTVTPRKDLEGEVVFTPDEPEPSPFPSYEEHWKGLQATFYRPTE